MQVRVDNYDKMLKALAKGEKMVLKEITTVLCNPQKTQILGQKETCGTIRGLVSLIRLSQFLSKTDLFSINKNLNY